ncbi:MAG: hypothetical protein ACLQPD_19345 [Desulfomonilaceae bacterium]
MIRIQYKCLITGMALACLPAPGSGEKVLLKVSDPEGTERIIAVAATKPHPIIPENEFSEYSGGFKSHSKSLKTRLSTRH